MGWVWNSALHGKSVRSQDRDVRDNAKPLDSDIEEYVTRSKNLLLGLYTSPQVDSNSFGKHQSVSPFKISQPADRSQNTTTDTTTIKACRQRPYDRAFVLGTKGHRKRLGYQAAPY